MRFDSLPDIQAAGFLGYATVASLQATQCSDVPNAPGVYLVLRTDTTAPVFLLENIGGHFQGRNPTLPLATISSQWVAASPVLYIGQTTKRTLRHRLQRLMRFGAGKPVGHWGGRCIWQLADSAKLLVCWKVSIDPNPASFEAHLIQEFKRQYGRRPFANLRD